MAGGRALAHRASIRFRNVAVAALLIGLAVVPVGCEPLDSYVPLTYHGPPSTLPSTLTEVNDGYAYTCKVGDSFKVSLQCAPMFDYIWRAALAPRDAALFEPLDNPTWTPEPVPEDIISDVGRYTFTFTAIAPGQATVRLEAWGHRGTTPYVGKTYAVVIIIEDDGPQ